MSPVEIPVDKPARKPQKTEEEATLSKNEPEKKTTKPPIEREAAAEEDDEPSQTARDFVRRIPDLSFMLSTKLVLPKKK